MSGGRSPSRSPRATIARAAARGPFRIFAEDGGGNYVTLTYFNNPGWGKKQLPLGEPRIVSGRLDRYGQELQIVHPDYVLQPAEAARSPSASRSIRCRKGSPTTASPISPARRWRGGPTLAEWIEPSLKAQQDWPDWAEALETAHRDPRRGAGARAARL